MKQKFARCIPFDKNTKGRIGGNPPITTEGSIPKNYIFYATLIHPEKTNCMLSIFIHQDFDILIEKNIYPNIEVKIIEHQYSEEGTLEDKRIKDISVNSIGLYVDKIDNDNSFLIKIYGEPRFIQPKNYFYEELENDGYSYFLQIDEEGYSDDLLIDNYPFHYGALYLYKHNKTGEIIAGFWQYS